MPVLVRRALADDIDHVEVDEAEAEARAGDLHGRLTSESHALTVVYPGVRDTLKWLHKQGVEMALITNKPERFVAPLLDQMKSVVTSLDHRRRHPAAEKTRPGRTVFCDENGQHSGARNPCSSAIRAAMCWRRKRRGCKCVALSYGYNHGRPIAEESPALVIDDLRKLIPGCLDPAAEITLPDAVQPPPGNAIVVVTRKLWMKVIKALARWRWRA